jgi:large subunit ribosomal protein L17
MQHHRKNRTLGRKKGQRVALLRSLARSLVIKEGITTTIARAKELRPYVERLVSASKKNTLSSRRSVAAEVGVSGAAKMHGELRERFGKRAGGYTRIVRLGRVGKRAIESARIEFIQ